MFTLTKVAVVTLAAIIVVSTNVGDGNKGR